MKYKTICFTLSLLFILATGGILIGQNNNQLQKALKVKEEPVKEMKQSITLSVAGDVTLGNYHGSSYYGSFNHEVKQQQNNYSYFLDGVNSVFENDDLSIVNLEGPLTVAQNPKIKQFAFKGNPEYVNILTEGDIEAVSISNNHSEDYFEQGTEDTKSTLNNSNIKYFGMGEKSILEVKGIKIGSLGYNGWPENYNEEYLDGIKKDIENLKKEADSILVYFHWGSENSYYPNEIQKNFAHDAIDLGADIVIGSHPHVVQGIEKYKDKYIAYSLGNFCFGGNKNPRDKDSFIYQQTLDFEGGKLVSINEPKVIPVSISSSNNRNDYKPVVLEGEDKERIINKVKNISENLNK